MDVIVGILSKTGRERRKMNCVQKSCCGRKYIWVREPCGKNTKNKYM